MTSMGSSVRYLRIRYLRADGLRAPTFDSYVMPFECSLASAIVTILREGFCRVSSSRTTYDENTRIAPGAIMDVTECDPKGYTEYDLQEIKNNLRKVGVAR